MPGQYKYFFFYNIVHAYTRPLMHFISCSEQACLSKLIDFPVITRLLYDKVSKCRKYSSQIQRVQMSFTLYFVIGQEKAGP